MSSFKDPGKNRIGQWLNVSLSHGMAELSLPLSSEPTLGEYSIRVKGTGHTISVEEYVLPKFEVTLRFPEVVMFNSEQFPLHVCGRYTYGKPVQGNYTATVCRQQYSYSHLYWWWQEMQSDTNICAKFSGKVGATEWQLDLNWTMNNKLGSPLTILKRICKAYDLFSQSK
ncbi:hypothetical protein AB205_0040310 [Aquarana catesbeiana]|uniref:Macroglobulin domain-containing protein n=1 Tax=Aquarana catesbeiana TaxID=8400 RepID=A0A2G9QJ80_AQUCT|nr:hypothetical protein AB205_0040310 [Aquarana catesbeiana]